MGYWTDLPNEVLLDIFRIFNKSDLLQCRLSCKFWNSTSASNALSKIKLLDQESAFSFISHVGKEPSLGNWVLSVEI
jgi:hypothetical protein